MNAWALSLRIKTLTAIPLLIAFTVASADTPPAAITVDLGRPGVKVSPSLYGIFFEEINRAGDGGLYAEMIQNRSFEDAPEPVAWTLIKAPGADVEWTLDKERPISPGSPNSLRLDVKSTGGQRVGVANDGFKGVPLGDKHNGEQAVKDWLPKFADSARKSMNGLAVEQGRQYNLSLYARSKFAGTRLTVTLEKQNGTVLGTQTIPGISTEWRKFQITFLPTGSDTNARLVISTTAAGTFWLDMVSLFPRDTFKSRENGLRLDLAQMLADMHPAFVRFPGGSFVEGGTLEHAYRWKKTIGDIAMRPGFWGIWGYRSTDGLGYHEYLQMCEDLGAEPLFVINCGMSEKEFAPVNQLGEWVQDAVDAIEYANGPVSSKWGALRAKNGHPASFGLKYVEIGNENGLSFSWGGGNKQQYKERYLPFYNAIKEKYPSIITIATASIDAPMEVVDEHFYENVAWFQDHANKYDTYDRKGPKIYVGEYAMTKDCGGGNLKAAVAEAAFMTGMERNSDVVIMSSYAPLFVTPAWKKWNPNAIVFDNSHAYGTPSYYVQSMFAGNRPDVIFPVQEDPSKTLFVVAGRRNKTGEIIIKLVNASTEPQSTTINLRGMDRIATAGKAIVLTSANPNDENSFSNPTRIAPKEEPLNNSGQTILRKLPPCSVTILLLRTTG